MDLHLVLDPTFAPEARLQLEVNRTLEFLFVVEFEEGTLDKLELGK